MPESLSKPTLPTFSWIGHLKPDDRELLSSYGEFFPGHPGNIIIAEGSLQTEVFVVISGELEVRSGLEDGGEGNLLATVGPGETIGEISLFDPGPATATVTATEFSQLWRIADADLIQFMGDNPGAGNLLLRTLATILAQRLRRMDPKAFGLSAYAVVGSAELPESPRTAEPEPASVVAPGRVSPLGETPQPLDVQPGLDTTPISDPYEVPEQIHRTRRTDTQAIPDPDELEPL